MTRKPKRLAVGRGGPEHLRSIRASQVRARADAASEAAAALVDEGVWPSIAAVAARCGLSRASVERSAPSLTEARRAWVALNGPHPHWQDSKTDPAPARDRHTAEIGHVQDQLEHALASLKQERERRGQVEARIRSLEEENRRLYLKIRPSHFNKLL